MTRREVVLPGDPALPGYARAVLAVVEAIPPGKVLTYGDVAELLEAGGPRQVGAVMARYGAAVPWWRVVNAAGVLPPGLRGTAARQYRAEGTAYDESGERVRLRVARWDGG